jgi:hypothetical protein
MVKRPRGDAESAAMFITGKKLRSIVLIVSSLLLLLNGREIFVSLIEIKKLYRK